MSQNLRAMHGVYTLTLQENLLDFIFILNQLSDQQVMGPAHLQFNCPNSSLTNESTARASYTPLPYVYILYTVDY